MEMLIGNPGAGSAGITGSGAPAAPGAIAAAGGKSAPNGQSGDPNFGRLLLVQQAGGKLEPSTDSSAGLTMQLINPGFISQELTAMMRTSTNEQLNAQLDALLQQLESGQDNLTEEQQTQLDAALDELNALMLAMFGFPLLPEQAKPLDAAPADVQAGDLELPGPGSRTSALIDTLSFLKSFLQEGLMKPLGKEEAARFHQVLDKLTKAAAGSELTDMQVRPAATSDAQAAQAVVTVQQPKESHLQRLGRQPVHAALVAVVAEASQSGAAPQQQAAETQPIPSQSSAMLMQHAAQAQGAGMQEAQLQADADNSGQPQLQQALTPASTTAAETVKTAEQAKPVQTVPIQRLGDAIAGMAVRQLHVMQNGGITEARIMLTPEHLGQLDVRISMQNGQMTAQFIAESAAAKEIIENQLGVLRNALQNQGLNVEKLVVAHGGAAEQSAMFQEQRQRGRDGQPFQNSNGNNGENDGMTAFEAELVEQAASRDLGYGRGINVTA